MPLIKCIAAYRTQAVEWPVGKVEQVSDEVAALLLRDSPGSFEVVSPPSHGSPASPQIAAMSSQTQTGLIVPDRRARGGRRR